MEKTNILNADLLDILFDGRNKDYGAYQLRKTYDKRIRYALGGTFLVCLLFLVGTLLAGGKKKNMDDLLATTITLEKMDQPKEEKVEPPKEKPKEQPPVEQVRSVVPKIVADDLVKPEDEMPDLEKLEDTKIGTVTQEGTKDDGVIAPPVEASTRVTDGDLKPKDAIDEIVIHVQIEAQYPGGMSAWKKFLERNLNRDLPSENGAPAGNYKVIVSFVVDRDGNLSDILAENDPGYGTKDEAIKAILKSQKWTPALQNGRNVKYRQKQAITFSVTD